ncbi:RHS repeat domain-containing protein [Ralstonia solanacearum]|uniref:RHS repeat protein n=1 Tax=Ralstonia solanacearum TaxID=305 RepID=A0AAE3NJY3_RALSL|nr:RHS repeat domain-containing protein [Ralstonia solanacearum]MDB0523555.1 RHS repeat protein [Ralstonia solanacearum]
MRFHFRQAVLALLSSLIASMAFHVSDSHARRVTVMARTVYQLTAGTMNVVGNYDTPQAAAAAYLADLRANGCDEKCVRLSGWWEKSSSSSLYWGHTQQWCQEYVNVGQNFTIPEYCLGSPYPFMCPAGWTLDRGWRGGAGNEADPSIYEPTCFIDIPDQQCPEGSCHGQGDPIFPEDGTYRLSEVDYIDPRGTLSFQRYYNSSQHSMEPTLTRNVLPFNPPAGFSSVSSVGPGAGISGQFWISDGGYLQPFFGSFRYINSARTSGNLIQVSRPGGLFYDYNWGGTNASPSSPSTHDVLRFSPPASSSGATDWTVSGQWTIRRALSDETERYDANGVLRQIQFRNGQTNTLTYSDANTSANIAPGPGYLIGISDTFGKSLSLRYDGSGRLATLIDPVGQTVTYTYESVRSDWSRCAAPGCFRVKTVTYPDGKTKTYHWDEADYTSNAGSTNFQYNLLTGVTDENGQRYSTIRYDSQGRAVSTELAGGVFRYAFSNLQPRTSVTVTDPLGTQRTFNFVNAAGLTQLSSLTGAACDDCGPASATYDSNGNVASQTDFNGAVTCFGYDLVRNLETARIEGLPAGTACPTSLDGYTVPANARKISTQWHPVWRQPVKVASPKQITTYVFNGDSSQYCAPTSAKVDDTPIGVVCSQSIQPTTDANGSQGFGATTTGEVSTTQWTYDSDGQLLTVKGPRTDVNDQASFSYRALNDTANPPQYRRGDLYQITDALGRTTTIDQMDRNGRPLQMTDPNGVVTTFTYAPRGWLTNQTATPAGGAGQTTSYGYDNAGQLTKVMLPDGSFISLSYDGAHRLTGISDSQGNSITYTVDPMGNRTQEQAKDSGGTLSRQVTRVIDSLNRLQKVTVGAVQ